ncbi:MAG: DsbE family thiol:disulfide interchange protein [Betaproteobacteria bacterium]
MKVKSLIPFIGFLVLVIFLGIGLNRNPREVPSPLVNKKAPLFNVAQLADASLNFSPKDMQGKVWIFNVWASWCGTCREEHAFLLELRHSQLAPIIGLDYKDKRHDSLEYLKANGDPYTFSVYDENGKVGIDYGVYGVPETYVIDKVGVIRFKQIGPITEEVLKTKINPLIIELNRS